MTRLKADPVRLPGGGAARHRVGPVPLAAHVERRGVAGAPRGGRSARARRCRSTRCTPASWRQGLGWRDLADELVRARRGARLHARRADARHAAPVRAVVGLPGDRVLRARRRRSASRTTCARSSTSSTGTGSACCSTGCRPTSRATSGRSPASTARRCTSTPTRAAARTPTGARSSSTTRATRCGTSCSRTRSTGCEEFHADGLRVDAVASMLYLDYSREAGRVGAERATAAARTSRRSSFLRELNAVVHGAHPGVAMIAEESTAWPGVSRPTDGGGLGFTFKWNMGWMHDTLDYVAQEPVHRRWHHDELTFSLVYAWDENFVLPLSHDEVVHGKGSLLRKIPGDEWQQFATLRALYGHMWAHPGKQLLFMGGEIGAGHRVVGGRVARLVRPRLPAPRGGAPLRRRPQPRLPRRAGAVGGRLPARGVRVARRRRARGQRARLRTVLGRPIAGARVPGQLLPGRPPPLARAAPGRRDLARGAEHRRGRVRRLGRRETSAAWRPSTSRCTAGRSPRGSPCRRSPRSGSCRNPDARGPAPGPERSRCRTPTRSSVLCRFVRASARGEIDAAEYAARRDVLSQ